MPVTTRSKAKNMITPNDIPDVKKSSTCSTNRNGTPPCADGFTMKLNKKRENCCYKLPKRKSPEDKKKQTNKEGNADDALKMIVNQHESIKDLIKNQLSPKVIGEARLSQLVENKAELYKVGESNVKKFFSKWLKGGDTIARYFLDDEGKRLYEYVEDWKLTVAPSKQHKYMLDHLKYKYKHLRLGKLGNLRAEEKERAHKFWQTFANSPLARKNVEKFHIFKTAIQSGIDSYFYLRKKVYEPEYEEQIDEYY